MKKTIVLLGIALFNTLVSGQLLAGDSQSGQAIHHGVQAGSHASASAAHAVVGSGQVTSAVSAVPLGIAGSVGAASADGAEALMESAAAPIGTPLDITDEAVTAGPPPNQALTPQKMKENNHPYKKEI